MLSPTSISSEDCLIGYRNSTNDCNRRRTDWRALPVTSFLQPRQDNHGSPTRPFVLSCDRGRRTSMDTNEHEAVVLTHHPAVSLRPLTVTDYQRMGEAGIFAENERVELIEGQLVVMSPIGSPHFAAVNTLNRLLVRAVEDRATVSVQNPVRLNERNEPEPDLALLRPHDDEYRSALP